MISSDFVRALANTAPSNVELKQSGFSSKEAENLRNRYFCVRRAKPLDIPSGIDELLNLLRDWELCNIQVGMVRFPVVPVQQPGKFIVGCVEADPLVLLLESGELVVYEFGTDGHLLWRVAKDGSSLLDALLIAATFLEKRGSGEIAFDDYDAAMSTTLECAYAAGGTLYLDFYTMLLGAMA